MPKFKATYKVLEKSYLPDLSRADGSSRIYEAGEQVEYEGLAGGNLEPTCDVGRSAAKAYAEQNKARRAQMMEDFRDASIADPEAFGAAVGRALAAQMAPKAKATA